MTNNRGVVLAQEKTVFETLEVEKTLGWRVFRLQESEIARIISSGNAREIVRLRNGKTVYVLKNLPQLSSEEALLLKDALEEFRKSAESRNSVPAETLEKYCGQNGLELETTQLSYLKKTLELLSRPAGMISELLQDEELEEIAVTGLGKAKPVRVFDKTFGWLPTNLYFSSEETFRNLVNAMAGTIGRRITLQKPKLNAVLKDGSRINACIEPASFSGPSLTIRKFRKAPFTPVELARLGTVSFEELAFLWLAIQSDCSMLVCGNTGSGKTTLLNSLFSFVPENERIISVEETPEISVPHEHYVKLNTAEEIGLGMQELIVNTLRMRPDRVIVGEVREAGEAKAFMDTLLAGQGKGCYATFHAQSANEALLRLRSLGLMEADLASIDLMLVQKRWTDNSGGKTRERRKLLEICETSANPNGGVSAEKIFSYNFAKNEAEKAKRRPSIYGKICGSFGFREKIIWKEVKERAAFLKEQEGKGMEEFFSAVQGYGKA